MQATTDNTGGEIAPAVTAMEAIGVTAQFYADPVDCVEKLHQRFGDIVRMRMPTGRSPGSADLYLFVGARYNREILMNRTSFRPTGVWPVPGPEGSALQNLRRNLLCLRGAEHDRYIAPVVDILGREKVVSYIDNAAAIIDDELNRWPVGEVARIDDLAKRLTKRLAFEIVFGAADYEDAARPADAIDEFHERSWSGPAMLFKLNAPWTPYGKLMRSADDLQNTAIDWMNAPAGCPAHGNLRREILKTAPTPEQAAANFAAIGMASYETTALSLSWALFLLSQHVSALAALEEEVGGLDLGDVNAVMNAPYLEGAVKETMRLVAPVPVIGFRTVEDCSIAGVDIAEEASVYISPHLTHMDPAIYDAPRRFRPERWRSIKPSGYEYLPFSAGPRRCPGMWFAMNNMKLALAGIVARYHVTPPAGRRVDRAYAATTIPKGGLPMLINRRADADETVAPLCAGNVFDFIDVER